MKEKKGFTLIELLVAFGVFAFVVSLASAVFIKIFKNERRLATVMSITSELNSALEQLSREIRTGYYFNDGVIYSADAQDFEDSLSFYNPEVKRIEYYLLGNKIFKNIDGQDILITSPNIKVEYLKFKIIHERNCDPWRVTIFLGVSPLQRDLYIEPFSIQTTVSSRIWPADVPVEFRNQYPNFPQCNY